MQTLILNPNSLSIVIEQSKSFKILQLPLLSTELRLMLLIIFLENAL